MEKENVIEYFDKIVSSRVKWKRRNKYYYNYLEGFLKFLTPENKKVLRVQVGDNSFWKKEKH